MSYKLPAHVLRSIYTSMLEPARSARPAAGRRILQTIAAEGWAMSWQVDDLLEDSDTRLNLHRSAEDLEEFGRAFELHKQHVCHRPRAIARSVALLDAWSAIDFARLLCAMEDLGFNIDPSPLVEALRPTIPAKGYITNAALDLLWYERQRHKSAVTISADSGTGSGLSEIRNHKLANGYKAEAWLDTEGAPIKITVRGPKHRRVKQPVEVKCECGHTWYRGDTESSAGHRKEHKRRMAYLDPQPHPEVLKETQTGGFDEHVNWLSPSWRQEEMYRRAFAFKRELRYDFVQWSASEDDPNAHGFLFADGTGRLVGATAFRLREPGGLSPRWGLQWIWVAPGHRRAGVLRERWAMLRERFGEFNVESPVSDAMEAFLHRQGDEGLMDWEERAYSLGTQSIRPKLRARS